MPEGMKTGSSSMLYFFLEGTILVTMAMVTWRLLGGGVAEWRVVRLEKRC